MTKPKRPTDMNSLAKSIVDEATEPPTVTGTAGGLVHGAVLVTRRGSGRRIGGTVRRRSGPGSSRALPSR
jgi:hypothetical protein